MQIPFFKAFLHSIMQLLNLDKSLLICNPISKYESFVTKEYLKFTQRELLNLIVHISPDPHFKDFLSLDTNLLSFVSKLLTVHFCMSILKMLMVEKMVERLKNFGFPFSWTTNSFAYLNQRKARSKVENFCWNSKIRSVCLSNKCIIIIGIRSNSNLVLIIPSTFFPMFFFPHITLISKKKMN